MHVHTICIERCRRKETTVISCYMEAYIGYYEGLHEFLHACETVITVSQACKNSNTPVLTLNAGERVYKAYKPIYIHSPACRTEWII